MNRAVPIAAAAFVLALSGCGSPARRAPPEGSASADSPYSGNRRFARLAVGGTHACYVDSAHTLWCWGGNAAGQLGNGVYAAPAPADRSDPDSGDLASPFAVPALRGRAAQVAAGGRNTCAITVDGELWCWGDIEGDPRLPSYDPRPRRRDIGGKAVGAWVQADHACALRDDGALLCWDRNGHGSVTGMGRAVQACVGWDFSCALGADGRVFCREGGARERSGADTALSKPSPEPVSLPVGAASIACGEYHACALDAQGQAWCWGRGSEDRTAITGPAGPDGPTGRAGTKPSRLSQMPYALEGLALGNRFTLGLERGGQGRVWGDSPMAPGSVLDHAVQIAAQGTTACALREDDAVWCWGTGQNYQLGNGKREDSRMPIRIPFGSK
jgi:alpha-tubulin suppressor-like RCC1 family protein